MFGRTIVQQCQKNLTCRLLHMENVLRALRNDVKFERKSAPETSYAENIHDVKSELSSSRINSHGYKIASKKFEFFI